VFAIIMRSEKAIAAEPVLSEVIEGHGECLQGNAARCQESTVRVYRSGWLLAWGCQAPQRPL
jgi:hypothetical protein